MNRKKEFEVTDIKSLESVALFLKDIAITHRKVFFDGEMGAGKTTLIKQICQALEVHETVTSPTFAICNIYNSRHGNIVHIDAYRLKNVEEAIQAGLEDYLFDNSICFIEWFNKLESIIPTTFVLVEINEKAGKRMISIHY